MLSLFCGKVDLDAVESAIFGVPEEHEDIRLHVFSVDEVLSMLALNAFNNAMTIISIQWFQLHKDRLDQTWLAV